MAKEITPPNLNTGNNQVNPDGNQIKAQPLPQTPAAASAAGSLKPKPRVKPLIEGINAPRGTADITYFKTESNSNSSAPLTDTEKKLIATTPDFKQQAPQLISDSSPISPNKPKSSVAGWFIALVILLILIAAGYGFYTWNQSKNLEPGGGASSVATNQDQTQTQPSASSSTAGLPILPPQTATTTPATSTPQVPVLTLKVGQTPTGYLNVRSQPSTGGSIITKIKPGETYTYTTVKNDWYQITLNDGTSGWVSGQYIKVQ
ncbi:MAG: SH3 domain-containing protein [Candidatus Doudnabacteria bacterium]|nr:SH3 domain-containing protein [Candidatus Doudnabacteria bacterium]